VSWRCGAPSGVSWFDVTGWGGGATRRAACNWLLLLAGVTDFAGGCFMAVKGRGRGMTHFSGGDDAFSGLPGAAVFTYF